MSSIFNISIEEIKSALVSTLLMGVLAILTYIITIGDVYSLDVRALVNSGVIAVATGLVSVIKSLLTNQEGKFADVIQIK